VIFETLTDFGRRFAMAQVFIPEISAGDKRRYSSRRSARAISAYC
jgi:glutathione synthase/RimK-type ligase-like ATP-grasp enzyme